LSECRRCEKSKYCQKQNGFHEASEAGWILRPAKGAIKRLFKRWIEPAWEPALTGSEQMTIMTIMTI
jgi:hypothetical protein